MIDSVTLLISADHFKIIDQNRFNPSPHLVYNHQIIKAVANSTKHKKRAFIFAKINLATSYEFVRKIKDNAYN